MEPIDVWVPVNCRAEDALEAAARTAVDGIPRQVMEDGTIMKLDWELCADTEGIDEEGLEDHVRRLLEAQDGEQGR